ncbi:MAG: hypothetical protein AAGG11_00955 [Pseudomonadota bacterium]
MLWAFGLGIAFRPFHQGHVEYVPYLVAGLSVWNFLSGAITSGASVFTANAGIILNTPTLPMQHVVRLWTNLNLRFVLQLIVFVPVALYYDMLADVRWSGAVLGLVVMSLIAMPMILLAGIANTYLRDVEPMIAVVMRFFFFITPVFWIPVGDRLQTLLVQFNPFFYLLELLRRPLLGATVESATLALCLLLLLCVLAAAFGLLKVTRTRLAVWL